MGASAREIEQQIKETRERMDENLEVLEHRAASSAVRYGKIAAVVVGAAALAGAGFLLWRRTRRPTLKGRLASLLRHGLLCSKSRGRLQAVWLHSPAASTFLTQSLSRPYVSAMTYPSLLGKTFTGVR